MKSESGARTAYVRLMVGAAGVTATDYDGGRGIGRPSPPFPSPERGERGDQSYGKTKISANHAPRCRQPSISRPSLGSRRVAQRRMGSVAPRNTVSPTYPRQPPRVIEMYRPMPVSKT